MRRLAARAAKPDAWGAGNPAVGRGGGGARHEERAERWRWRGVRNAAGSGRRRADGARGRRGGGRRAPRATMRRWRAGCGEFHGLGGTRGAGAEQRAAVADRQGRTLHAAAVAQSEGADRAGESRGILEDERGCRVAGEGAAARSEGKRGAPPRGGPPRGRRAGKKRHRPRGRTVPMGREPPGGIRRSERRRRLRRRRRPPVPRRSRRRGRC